EDIFLNSIYEALGIKLTF
ncbi:MAG: hypothetical protein GW803_02560, partial [Caldiserica bacterium]|nr:hypothetical protein [Caldisericota bacterium]